MRKAFYTALYITAALLITGCAKTVTPGPNEANKRYFDAWMQINHPGVEPSGLGVYVLDSSDGDGVEVKEDGFALVNFKITDLEGNISSYTDTQTAKQLGEYSETAYYGPKFWTTHKTTIQAGLGDALYGMKAGGYKNFIVPSWLMTAKSFDTAEEYLEYYDEDNSSSFESTIYEIEVVDFTEDISQWQIDSIGRFFSNNSIMIDGRPANQVFSGMTAADSVSTGFYYKQLKAPVDTTSFPTDTTIYINYTGKLLNGLVFDTTIERVAKDSGLYSDSRTYEPVQIKWGKEYSEIAMGSEGSTVIG